MRTFSSAGELGEVQRGSKFSHKSGCTYNAKCRNKPAEVIAASRVKSRAPGWTQLGSGSMRNQSFMAGYAEPLAIFLNPDVDKAAVMQEWLPIFAAVLAIGAVHHNRVPIRFSFHPFIDDLA